MKKYLFLVFLIPFINQLDKAKAEDFSVDDFLAGYHQNSPTYVGYAIGVSSGIFWSNVELAYKHQTPLFCQPGKLSITHQQFVQIIEDHLRRVPSDRQYPLGMVAMTAMQKTFPCS